MSRTIINEYGKRYGRLRVVGKKSFPGAWKRRYWVCKCACGNAKIVSGLDLRSGHSRSCGCLLRTQNGQTTQHPSEYHTWASMNHRCYNQKDLSYNNYGGRGIRICGRWRDSFENFLSDMGERPAGKEINRINNDGDYSPDNCEWCGIQEQQLNRRVFHNGIPLSVDPRKSRQRRWQIWRYENGLCEICGEKRDSDLHFCMACRQKRKKRYKAGH
jgi:hypothetical protein